MPVVSVQLPIDILASGPSTPGGQWERMQTRWKLPHALMGGTLTMRTTEWLPQHPVERLPYYNARLARSTLTNYFGMSVKNLSGRPFAKPVRLIEPTSPEIAELADDIDGRGQNLTQFARALFEGAMIDGMVHVLAILPRGFEDLSLGDQRAIGLRPFLRHVPAPNLLSALVSPNGQLTRIVIYEPIIRPSVESEWVEETVNRYRVIWPDRWQLWERQSTDLGGQMVVIAEGDHSFGRIPLTTIYFNRKGDMEAWPPLENMAWANLKHFQVSSDQDNVLHFVSIPLLFGKGIQDLQSFEIAAGMASIVDDDNASLEYVEHKGGAVGDRRQQLLDLEELMQSEAGEMMTRRPAGVTATAVAIEFAGPRSWLEAMSASLQSGLQSALLDCGRWMMIRRPQVAVNVFQEFGIGRSREDLALLFQAARPGVGMRPLISDDTFITEATRRGMLEDNVTPEAEAAAIDDQKDVETGMMPGAPLGKPKGQPAATAAA